YVKLLINDDTLEKVIYESSSTSDSEQTESDTETAAPKATPPHPTIASSPIHNPIVTNQNPPPQPYASRTTSPSPPPRHSRDATTRSAEGCVGFVYSPTGCVWYSH
ncbi:hypothetical protein Tco_0997691, partial [Tanacetum coccineum]